MIPPVGGDGDNRQCTVHHHQSDDLFVNSAKLQVRVSCFAIDDIFFTLSRWVSDCACLHLTLFRPVRPFL